MRLISNCTLQEPECQVWGTAHRLKHYSERGKVADLRASLPMPTSSLMLSGAVTPGQPGGHDGVEQNGRESCTGKGQQSGEQKRETGRWLRRKPRHGNKKLERWGCFTDDTKQALEQYILCVKRQSWMHFELEAATLSQCSGTFIPALWLRENPLMAF